MLEAICGIRVEFINIARGPGATTSVAECNLAEPSDFFDRIGGALIVYDINLVSGTVGVPEKTVFCKFRLDEFLVNGAIISSIIRRY